MTYNGVSKPRDSLQWRHNERNDVSNHRRLEFFSQPFVQAQIKETSKLRVTGLCEGWTVDSPHKGPLTRKMFPFDDVIMDFGRNIHN